MSIATAIIDLSGRIQDAYEALSSKGAVMPATKNSANLSATVDSIQGEDLGKWTINRDLSSYDSRVRTGTIFTYTKQFQPSAGKIGISNLSVQARLVRSTTYTPTTHDHTISAGTAYMGYESILVKGVTSAIDANIQAGNIKSGVTILGVTGTYSGSGGGSPTIQGYTVTVQQSNTGWSPPTELTCFKTDGTSQVVTSGTVNDVMYVGFSTTNVTWQGGNGGALESSIVANNIYHGISGGIGTTYVHVTQNTTFSMNCGCILKGEMVNLWNGKTKPIEQISYDDEVLCWDFDEGRFAKAKPFWIKKSETTLHYWINSFASGKKIKTTGTIAGHRFFNVDKGGFAYNVDCVENECFTVDGPDKLIECVEIKNACEFYNIYTHHHMNLFINGILTGFRYNNIYPVENMKFIKDNRVLRGREEFKDLPDSWFYGMRCAEQTVPVEEIKDYALSRESIKNG